MNRYDALVSLRRTERERDDYKARAEAAEQQYETERTHRLTADDDAAHEKELRLAAERKLSRVEALRDEWSRNPREYDPWNCPTAADELIAALADEEPT